MNVDEPEFWNGGRIERRSNAPIGAIAFAVLACALAGVGAAMNERDAVIAAIFPGALAIMLLVFRERPFVATFAETKIIIGDGDGDGDPPAKTIPYSTIDRLWADDRYLKPGDDQRKPFSFHVQHADGLLRVPPLKSPSSYELYCYLESFMPAETGREVVDELAEFLQRQVALRGEESVYVFRAADRLPPRPFRRRLIAVSAATIVSAVAWIVIAALSPDFVNPPWGPIGIIAAVYAAIFLLASFVSGRIENRFVKNWKKSCLVVAPGGIAMVQGDVAGHMGWRDVLELAYQTRPGCLQRFFQVGPQRITRGIRLKVQGADIVIPDIYDRPLFLIYERMREANERRGEPAPSKRPPKTILDDLEIVDDLPEL